ncbi:MAG TPA: hypothetical protein VGU67_02900 [Edaphobacter sp.]|nr:hypothetical protein [Edaphobacter sp.]
MNVSMEGNYSFGSAMGDGNDTTADSLSDLLTYGAKSDDETTGQPNGAPTVKSDASAPIAPAAHVAAVANTPQPASSTPVQGSQPPVYTPPDQAPLQALNAQKVKDEQVSNVNPKWWERALGGLTAGAMAFGKVPGAVEAGQAVTNRGENAAEFQRQGRLKADNAGIQAWQDGQNQNQQTFQNQNTAFNDNQRAQTAAQLNADRAAQESQRNQAVAPGSEAPDDPKNPLGTWHATTVAGKPIALQGPPDKWAKSPTGVAAQRDADVERLKLTGDDAKFYRANGKLKEPGAVTNVHVPSEGQQAYNDALSSWKSDNPGKKPSLGDLRSIRAAADGKPDTGGAPKRGTAGQFSDLDKQTSADYAKAQAAYKVASEGATDNTDRQQAAADLAAENARIGAEHSQRLRDLGGVPAEDSQGSKPSAAPTSSSAPAKAPKPNTPLTDPAKAKAYLAAAGGDKAKARAAAAKDGWKF